MLDDPKPEKPIGVLYDSVSNNTGDIAIGIALQQYLDEKKIRYEIVPPFDYNSADYSYLIIGGGQLIRSTGDPFYDSFRVPGDHILNGVGVDNVDNLDYLNEYSSVSVRSISAAEKLNKQYPNLKIEVIPCVATLLDSTNEENYPQEEKTIGLHLVADTFTNCPGIIDVLGKLPKPKVTFSFTTYNFDTQLMPAVEIWGIKHHYRDMNPKQLHSLIGSMGGVIVSSLHATIFAYTQNIPFLTYYQPKTYEYLKDRGLERFVFKNTEELIEKLPYLDENWNFTHAVSKEKQAVRNYLDINIAKMNTTKNLVNLEHEVKVSIPEGKHDLFRFQLEDVISHRDQLIAANSSTISELRLEIKKLISKVKGLESEKNDITMSKRWKLANLFFYLLILCVNVFTAI